MKYFHKFRYILIVILVGYLLLGLTPRVASRVLTNLGLWEFIPILIRNQSDIFPDIYPKLSIINKDSSTDKVMKLLHFANQIDSNKQAQWAMIRLGLAFGDDSLYIDFLENFSKYDGLTYLQILDAIESLSKTEKSSVLIDFFEIVNPVLKNAYYLDLVAYEYNHTASEYIDIGDFQAAIGYLNKTLELRPKDLFANYYLYKFATASGDTISSTAHLDVLKHFSASSIYPADGRLVFYLFPVIENLIEEKIWNDNTLSRVLEVLVWKYKDIDGLQESIFDASKRFPNNMQIGLLVGEYFERNQNIKDAFKHYRNMLNLYPNNAEVAQRLLALCSQDSQICSPEKASHWHDILAQQDKLDPVVQKIYIELCDKFIFMDKDQCLKMYTDLQRSGLLETDKTVTVDDNFDIEEAARLLNIEPELLRIGPELLANPDFINNKYQELDGWKISDEIIRDITFRQHIYVGGVDNYASLDGDGSLRLVGLWKPNDEETIQFPGWYGVYPWSDPIYAQLILPIAKDVRVYMRGYYRTQSSNEILSIHIRPESIIELPATNGNWTLFYFVDCFPTDQINEIVPYIFLSKFGDQVWLDLLSIRYLYLVKPDAVPCKRFQQ